MEQARENNNQQEKGEKEMAFEKIAKENFVLWADTLLTKDPKKVAELYASDATFLPTVSPEFKTGQKETEGYFVHFLEKNPEGKIVEEKVQQLGQGTYLHSGMYDFELGVNGSRSTVEARFSFIWRKKADGGWEIIHHHSSVKPT